MVSLLNEVKAHHSNTENIVNLLNIRKSRIMAPNTYYNLERQYYTCLVPNTSWNMVKIPNGCYLRKFSPDGKFLLAFSQDQKNVELFQYNGGAAANHLFQCMHAGHDAFRDNLFNCFFKHLCSVLVSQGVEVLNRECSLFTDDNRYVIVSSSILLPDEPVPHMYETFRNNESLSPNPRYILEDYTLYIVDLLEGVVTDSHSFKCDKIFLSHNQGLSMCSSKLAVLSSQHQTIHVFEIIHGCFISQLEIGRFCYPDDGMIFSQAQFSNASSAVGSDGAYRPFLEKWINSLKHRFLCRIKVQAEAACTVNNRIPIFQFYKHFDYFCSLRIWKMQLLNDHTLLLKYTDEDTVTMKRNDPMSQLALFAFYNFETTRVEYIYPNTSPDFLNFVENYADVFRAVVSHPLSAQVCCVSNCLYGRSLHMKFKQTITNAKYGGSSEATKRLLIQLPVCSQSFSSSPYLDLSLFRYDDKWISPLERPKPCGDAPVK